MAEKKVKQKIISKENVTKVTFQLDFTFSEIDMSCLVGGSILGLEVIEKSLKNIAVIILDLEHSKFMISIIW